MDNPRSRKARRFDVAPNHCRRQWRESPSAVRQSWEFQCAAVDSGGIWSPHYFLKKNAEKDNSVLLALAVKRLENARREVEYAKSDSVLHLDGDWTYRISYYEGDVLREEGGFKTPIEAYNAAVTERNGFCWFNADIQILSEQEIEDEKLENCLEEDYNV